MYQGGNLMIQIISLNDNLKNNFFDNKNVKVTTFSDYQSFDMYDINIIEKQYKYLLNFFLKFLSGSNNSINKTTK